MKLMKNVEKFLLQKKWMNLDDFKPIDLDIIHDSLITEKTNRINQKLVKSSVTLLQNYEDLIPLKRLDTLKIASLSIGEKSVAFQEKLNYYTKVDTFNISEDADIKSQALILDKLSKYNLVIVSVHKSNANAWKDYKISKKH